MQIISASEARKNFFKLIDNTTENNEPITVTTRRKNIVIISEEDWNNMQETIYLMNNKELWKSIIEGHDEPLENCTKDLEW